MGFRATAILLLGLVGNAYSQVEQDRPVLDPTDTPEAAGEVAIDDPADPFSVDRLDAFLDGTVMTAMEEDHLPGIVVTIVHGDRLLFAKGWGYADVDANKPVDPNSTLFRIGSVSKTMTFTAVMQLVENGLINLDEDLSTYVGSVPIEDRYGELTMSHLMNHTPGYEDIYIGHFVARDVEQDYELADYLTRYAPKRVRPEGLMTSYSNYGVAMAGHVVAEVSGKSFEDYVDQHLFEPLGMQRTTFREYYENGEPRHMSKAMADMRAIGYFWADGKYQQVSPYHMHRGMAPAGSVAATGLDMARWMRVHLNEGRLGNQQILKPETMARMHEVSFRNADGMAGNAHGFWANQTEGYATLEHGGAIFGFLSNMVLLPELDLGIFVSTNGDNGRDFVVDLPRRVVAEFFPNRQQVPDTPPADFMGVADRYEGRYMFNRRGYTTVDKLGMLNGGVVEVSTSPDGYLLLDQSGERTRWMPLGDHRFASLEDGRVIAFRVDGDGPAAHFFGSYGHHSADRVNYFFTPAFFLRTVGLALACFVLVIIAAWLRRRRTVVQSGLEAFAARFLVLTALVWIGFFVSFGIDLMMNGSGSVPPILFAFPTQWAEINLWVAIVAAGMTGICLLALLFVWIKGNWTVFRRLRHTFVVLVATTMVWVLWEWKLLGFNYL